MGKNGGMFKVFKKIFRIAGSFSVGNDKQNMSMIHMEDVINAIPWLIRNPGYKGIYTFVIPERINSLDFAILFARKINRNCLGSVPAFFLKIFLGKRSNLLIHGKKVIPGRLISERYKFKFVIVPEILENLVK